MPDPTTQKLTIAEYKEAQTKLSELMANAVTGFAAAQQVGDLVAAKAWSETLVLPIASLKEQFLQLSPRDQFVSKYSVEKINAHQVRFIIPKGVSRIDLLDEAQGIAMRLYGRDAIEPFQLKNWQKEDDFRTKTTSKTKLGIDGRVKGLDGKTRKQQERLIEKQLVAVRSTSVVLGSSSITATATAVTTMCLRLGRYLPRIKNLILDSWIIHPLR
ncbi:MAG: hypothetical protein NTV65_11065 [Proteobacteria bacterium]|nr:hypothetical protein [Pseudomonadota bacterium]